jgi:hypothetical protein
MTDAELVKYGQSAAWMAEHNDRATWRVQLEEARAEWRRPHAAAIGRDLPGRAAILDGEIVADGPKKEW